MSQYADPNCPDCGGRGFIVGESMLSGGRYCDCTMDALRLQNMEKVWKSLSEAVDVPPLRESPPLLKLVTRNLWITAPLELFRRHLKAVCFHKSDIWDAKVRTDAELLDSWFGTAKAQGVKIYDIEVEKSTLEAIDIRDLVEPPELCVIVLGVKQLPNKEAPNSLLEAIGYRRHVGKPTWIVDQPDHPIDQMHHRFYSDTLDGWLKHWPHLHLSGTGARVEGQARIEHAVADTSSLDELVEDESTGSDAIDKAISDVDAMNEEEAEGEEVEYEYEEETGTTNMLDTLKVEADPKPYGKQKKKPWGGGRK